MKFLLMLSFLVMGTTSAVAGTCSDFPEGLTENQFTDKALESTLEILKEHYQNKEQAVLHQVAFFEEKATTGDQPNCQIATFEAKLELVYKNTTEACIHNGQLHYTLTNKTESFNVKMADQADCRTLNK